MSDTAQTLSGPDLAKGIPLSTIGYTTTRAKTSHSMKSRATRPTISSFTRARR